MRGSGQGNLEEDMRTREHHFHASKDIFAFWPTREGFGITTLFNPDIELGDRVVVGSCETAPALTGWIMGHTHDLKPEGHTMEIRVSCTDLAGIRRHIELYEKWRKHERRPHKL